jgi:adenosyl cobinamide kinase/adenosyl cobinamide phosphate guanylyltransferase
MKSRIKLHQKHRPRSWKTLEIEGEEIVNYLEKFSQRYKVVIIDCLAFLISNLLLKGQKESQIKKQIKNLAKFLSQKPFFIIVVSNEVGSGVVPENSLARRFRDLLGWTNQIMAQKADEVILVSAGLPLFLKNEKR